MQRILAIVGLTWKAAFRFRLFLVVAVLLLGSVVALPLLLKDDGTARGFTQILLTYTLSTIAALLGLSTLWLACGTLARDIEECQIQVVATKPIARWEIWLGKWLGLLSLDAALLSLSGACVFGLLQWRASHLPAPEQAVLRNEVLVARGSAREKSSLGEIQRVTERELDARLKKNPVAASDVPEVQRTIYAQVKAVYEVVPPGYMRTWKVDLGRELAGRKNLPMQLRIKFNSANYAPDATYLGLWYVGDAPNRPWQSEPMSLAADTFHEFAIPGDLVDDKGILTVTFRNENDTALVFPLEDGFEVLYHEGGFTLNFIRGLGIIFCWMALLATLGLTAASFLSFPVAAFVSLGVLTMGLCSGTMSGAVEEGTIAGWNAEKGTKATSPLDVVVMPTFRAALHVIKLVKDFSPIDSLSTGRSITWGQLARAFAQVILFLSGVLGLFGIFGFNRRELATAQGTQ